MGESQRPPVDPESRRLTPSIGFALDLPREAVPGEARVPQEANEDFLFHLYRGSELLQDNRVHEAKDELERALRIQPRDTKGQDLIAVVYFRLGLYSRAIEIYEELRKKSPRDGALLLNLALCYLKTGQPGFARRDLEVLLTINPEHTRAWGYLGLACERLGDLAHAQLAFENGGHEPMARRIAVRLSSMPPAIGASPRRRATTPAADGSPGPAFEELDQGELSLSAAEPVDPIGDALSRITSDHPETIKPDTRDGPPPSDRGPFSRPASAAPRRPTLLVGVPPPEGDLPPSSARPFAFDPTFLSEPPISFKLPSFSPLSSRQPIVAVPSPLRGPVSLRDEELLASIQRGRTLAPPLGRAPTAPPRLVEAIVRESFIKFPESDRVLVDETGVALVATSSAQGFAVRVEAIRVASNPLPMTTLERREQGKATGESFGGVGSPIVLAKGEGQLVLAARAGRRLVSFVLSDEICFVREDVLLGFFGGLVFENGKLAVGDGDSLGIVQLRGNGAVLLETTIEVLTLDVKPARGMSVRRDTIVGWFGKLVPRAVPPGDAPAGQRGIVSFAGEGRILVAIGRG